jgi:peptidoglycan/LPS O-acetylase OafA/YrhL
VRYRPEVDGLRAVAVLPVVLFHAGLASFQGGFVGVDIFFVISGYLITSIITEEIRQDRFSIVKFYERRVRRIFPALFAVLAVVSAAACWVLLPAELEHYARSVVAATLFASNIYFWRDSGYFDATAETKPLLHTWSLGVEEQFYIFFPIALYLLHRFGRKSINWVAAGTLASFVISIQMTAAYPVASFFLLPTRAWELFLGALISLAAFPRVQSAPARQALSIAGMGMIAWSVVTFSVATEFPGVSALWPCVGAALIIHSAEGTAVGRLLSLRPVVFVGLISYSLYLWHWSLLVLADLATESGLSTAGVTAVIAASFALAVASWRFVERPFRGRNSNLSRPRLFGYAAAAMAAAIVFGAWGMVSQGWPQRLDAKVVAMAEFTQRRLDQETDARLAMDPSHRVTFGAETPPSIALWGDSHTMSVALALGEQALTHGQSVEHFWMYNCLPVVGLIRHPGQPGCPELARDTLETIVNSPSITTAVLLGRWSYVLEGEVHRERSTGEFTDESEARLDNAGQRQLFRERVQATVNRLLDAGKRVVLIYPTPEYARPVPRTIARMMRNGRGPGELTLPLQEHKSRHAFVTQLFDELPNSALLLRVHPEQILCPQGECQTYAEGKPLYKDADHLTIWGARLLLPLFEPMYQRQAAKTVQTSGD